MPRGHPERPERLKEVLNALRANPSPACAEDGAQNRRGCACRVHSRDFIREILDSIPQSGFAQLDSDTIASPGTGEAILRAVGAVVLGVDMWMAGEVKNAFCACVRLAINATPTRAMGFCLFNNVAVGALHARAVHGLKRIAVVDFDVHHGNGTRTCSPAMQTFFYGSTHQSPLYPAPAGRMKPVLPQHCQRAASSRSRRQGIPPRLRARDSAGARAI